MSLEYVRRHYRVPARRGGRVRFEGKREGTITGSDLCGRIRVRFDGEKHASILHPTWEVEYLDATAAAPSDAVREFAEWLDETGHDIESSGVHDRKIFENADAALKFYLSSLGVPSARPDDAGRAEPHCGWAPGNYDNTCYLCGEVFHNSDKRAVSCRKCADAELKVAVVIRDGWSDAGKRGTALGPPVFVGQNWTPVLWDGEDDPDFFKTSGLAVADGSDPEVPQVAREKKDEQDQ